MAVQRPYRIMLAISEQVRAEPWLQLALRMLPENGEIWLRGLITIPEDRSLSEGALTARPISVTTSRWTCCWWSGSAPSC